MESFTPRVPQKARCQAREGSSWVPCDRTKSVFSKWNTTVLVDMLHDEQEPIEWKGLHVGAERGVNCEHMQALVTNTFQRHWEWQEDRRVDLQPGRFRYNTAFMTGLDVKTAFDVASVVFKILTLTGVHGHLTAALLAEMQDVAVCSQRCKMSVAPQALRTVRQNSGTLDAFAREVWRHLCCGDALPNMHFGKVRKNWRAKGWGLSFGGQHDNGYRCVG